MQDIITELGDELKEIVLAIPTETSSLSFDEFADWLLGVKDTAGLSEQWAIWLDVTTLLASGTFPASGTRMFPKSPLPPKFRTDLSRSPLLEGQKKQTLFFANFLALAQQNLQEYATSKEKDYQILVRFYVPNEPVRPTHPGLNSWAYFDQMHRGGKKVAYTEDQIKEIGLAHMYVGHDTPGTTVKDAPMSSPFVSMTSSVGNLVTADSPLNPDRVFSLAATRGEGDVNQLVMRGKNTSKKPDMRSALLRQQAHSVIMGGVDKDGPKLQAMANLPIPPIPQSTHKIIPATFVSDKIVALIYGLSSQELAEKAKEATKAKQTGGKAAMSNPDHVATHIAFVIAPRSRIFTPPADTIPNACCMLEKEAVIFAPDDDLNDLALLKIENLLPFCTGRFHTEM